MLHVYPSEYQRFFIYSFLFLLILKTYRRGSTRERKRAKKREGESERSEKFHIKKREIDPAR